MYNYRENSLCTDKKENKIFLIYKEIQNGAFAKSYMTNGFLIRIWGNICAFSHILGSPSSYTTLQLLHSEFSYIWGKFCFLFYQCGESTCCPPGKASDWEWRPLRTIVEVCLRLSMTSPLKVKYIIINRDENIENMNNYSTKRWWQWKISHNLSVCSFCDTVFFI